MEDLMGLFGRAIEVMPVVVAAASAVAAVTPTPKDDNLLGKIYKIVDFLAINIGKAKQTPQNSNRF